MYLQINKTSNINISKHSFHPSYLKANVMICL